MDVKSLFNKKFIPAGIVFSGYLFVNILLRLILMIHVAPTSHMKIWQYPVAFLIGILYDIAVGFFAAIPFIIHAWFQNDFIYRRKVIPFVIAAFTTLIVLLLFTHVFPKEFNNLVYQLVLAYIILRFVIYLFMCFVPAHIRQKTRLLIINIMLLITFAIIILNAASEWFFWQEFSSRYNFIAVDYLVYTNEVIGNIMESYPITLIFSGIILTALLVLFTLRFRLKEWMASVQSFGARSLRALLLLGITIILFFVINEKWHQFSNNEYANELSGDGIYQFGVAFKSNDLDFYKFYKTIPDSTAFTILREQLKDSNSVFTTNDIFNVERNITGKAAEKKLNVVLISVESLSGDFMKHFGNTQNITPYLDSLADKSLFFTNMYASGTRTVRGLEALTLSLPPVPGQSIIKRPDNANMFTIGSVFRTKGYNTQFIYGGYSYFDNMQSFFAGNGYEVIDRTSIKDADIHYQNIWGVADEDEFTLAIKTLDNNFAQQKPFFTHIMTVSNHRPFTYPEGRIDIPAASQSREGAVKYTDFCINKFLQNASSKPWYKNTVFVIVADHCASSAGSTQLPVTGYHIPLIIFSPGNIQPAVVAGLTAQIDIAPTVLGLLNFSYKTKFYGHDVLSSTTANDRAFISTYQGLGYIKNERLIIQSPVRKVNEYQPDFKTGTSVPASLNDSLALQAQSFYQSAAWLIKNKKFGQ